MKCYRQKKCKDCKKIFYTIEFEVEENKKFMDEWEVYKRTIKTKQEK